MVVEAVVCQLVYVSRATAGVSPADLREILSVARPHNEANRISGFLTFDGSSFCQLLEGPALVLETLMARIESDSRHDVVRKLWTDRGPRLLPQWAMHFEHFDEANPFVRDQVRTLIDRRGEGGPTRRQIQQLVLRLKLESLPRR